MIIGFLRVAHRLDEMLKHKLGRPYHAVLGLGLVMEIISHVRDLIERTELASGVIRLCLSVVFFGLLLLHQLGELSEHRATRRQTAHADREAA